jgi:uncharacterized repeat protein (TIGR01451 family)
MSIGKQGVRQRDGAAEEKPVINHSFTQSIYPLRKGFQLLAATVVTTGVMQFPAIAETQLSCNAPSGAGATLLNQVSYTYTDGASVTLNGFSEVLTSQVTTGGVLSITSRGIHDRQGGLIYSLGTIATALHQELLNLGWSDDAAKAGSVAVIRAFAALPADATLEQTLVSIKAAIIQAVPAQDEAINSGRADQPLAVALAGLATSSLQSIGLTATEARTATNVATAVVTTTTSSVRFDEVAQTAFQDAINAVPTQTELLTAAKQALEADLSNVRAGKGSSLHAGDMIRFGFRLTNTGSASIEVQPPPVADLQQGISDTASIQAIGFEGMDTIPASVSLAPGQQIDWWVETQIQEVPEDTSTVGVSLSSGCGGGVVQQSIVVLPPGRALPPIDPFGRVTGCAGETLPDYRGIQVALYRPAAGDNTGEVHNLLPLPATELPDNPNNNIPAGLEPNRQNSNPFFLTDGEEGKYNFLLAQNQLRPGQTYILVVSPAPDSEYSERRIRIVIGERTAKGFAYQATSLDGRPISATDNRTSLDGTLRINEATQVGISLSLLDLDTSICQAQAIQIVKTGDRAAAEPGDTVIYRLLVRNLSTTAIENLVITDTLPLGFSFINNSVRAELENGRQIGVTTRHDGSTISLQLEQSLPEGRVLSLAYAAQLTPDAVRGTGENSAIARGRRDDNDWVVRDGPSVHRLRIEPGIVSDCGTIIGRVFEDKNFDGEQQTGEPGIPNAVIYLDDGNRITTDANGLFSIANVLPGHRTGALDLTSLPGYTLAPNLRFIERNSPSRLVQLEPGGMVRMNFAVTPTFQEEVGQ